MSESLSAPLRTRARGAQRCHSRRTLSARLATLAALMVLGVVCLIGPAPAAEGPIQPAPKGSGEHLQSWGLAPTGTDPSQPSSRPTLSYELAPGATLNDSVTLWNFSDVQLTFRVYATDAYNNRTGQFTLLPGDGKPKDVGTWVKLEANNVTVQARTRIDIPVTLTVPLDATPGDHAAGIVASVPTPVVQNGQRLVIDRRTGTRIYTRVAGAVSPELVIENLNSDYTGVFNPLDGSLDVEYTIRNPGNVRLGARPILTVKDPLGRELATRKLPVIEELLPGNAVTFQEKVTGVPALFRLTTEVTLKPFAPRGVNEKTLARASASTNTWAIPWTLLLFLALLALGWRLYRRWKNARRGPAPLAPGSATTGRGQGPGPGQSGQPVSGPPPARAPQRV